MNKKLKIEIVVGNSKYFLKDLIESDINLYHVELKDNTLTLIVSLEDYKKIKKKKTIKKIKIIEYYGINKIIKIIKQYKILIISIILGIVLNIILSYLILEVEIITPNNNLKNIIKRDLQDLGISKGKWQKSFAEKSQIKEIILEKEKDKIEWLEISNEGTKYIIKVEERKQEESKETCLPRNIVSKKEAIITRIESSDGEIKVQVNDFVSPGTVLISGLIHNGEDIVAKTCAQGHVYGEVWYKGVITFPRKYKRLIETKNYSWALSFQLFDKQLGWPKKYKYYKKDEYAIISSDFLKFGVYLIKEYQEEEKSLNYSLYNIDDTAFEKAISEINKSFSEKPIVLKKNVLKKSLINSKIVVEVFIAIEEEITSFEDVSQKSIDELNKKEE